MKHSRVPIIAIPVVILLVFSITYVYFSQPGPSTGRENNNSTAMLNKEFGVGTLYIGNSSYHVYIANTLRLQELGYMNASGIGNCDGLGRCAGILFVFSNESMQCFWMKNTFIPLEQSWISDGRVNYTYSGTPLSQNSICSIGDMVLETAPSFPIHYGERVNYTGPS
jgi:Uncharacterized conserved protein